MQFTFAGEHVRHALVERLHQLFVLCNLLADLAHLRLHTANTIGIPECTVSGCLPVEQNLCAFQLRNPLTHGLQAGAVPLKGAREINLEKVFSPSREEVLSAGNVLQFLAVPLEVFRLGTNAARSIRHALEVFDVLV